MAEVCGEPHPDHPDVTCEKTRPCYITHLNHSISPPDWDGPPPPTTKRRRVEVDKLAEKVKQETFTGPPESKAEGMARAEAHTSAEFKEEFLTVLHALALERDTFTSDDVWEVLDSLGIDTESRAGVGPLMAHGARQGWTEKSGQHDVSKRPNSKARDGLTVWRSLLR